MRTPRYPWLWLVGFVGAMGCGTDAWVPEDLAPLGQATQAIQTAPSHWRTARGSENGTQAITGVGQLTGLPGGHPKRVWSYKLAAPGFVSGESVVGNFDNDPQPEVIGTSQGRLFLWNGDGSVLATSSGIPNAKIHGLYDLDGDGDDELLVAGGARVGLGLVVVDPRTLAVLWTSGDPGYNSSVNVGETVVADLDGDHIPEVVWDPAFCGVSTAFNVASFASGMAAPRVLATNLPAGYRNLVMPVAGNYWGTAGYPRISLATHQGTSLSFFGLAQPGTAGATCNGPLCLRVDAQFNNVTANHVFGEWMAFDANGDGDDEFLSTSRVGAYSVEITAFDPSAGFPQGQINTSSAVMWQLRYGTNTQIQTQTTELAVRGVSSSTGERIVPVSIYNAGTDEKDRFGAPANDCLSNSNRWGTVVFDAKKGLPLANINDGRVWGSLDSDRDGISEIVMQKDDDRVVGYELSCTSPTHLEGFQSCVSTGCTLVELWSVPGKLLQHNLQTRKPHANNYDPTTSTLVDLNGDDVAEVIVKQGSALVAYRLDQPSGPVEIGRYTINSACNKLLRVAGQGPNTRILLEGTNCLAVLDAGLHTETSFGVTQNHGSTRTLTGHVGVPFVALGTSVIIDPLGSNTMQSLSNYSTVAIADLDKDGLDELIGMRGGTGTWSARVHRWNGSAFQTAWTISANDLNDPSNLRSLATAGDYDGDNDLDIAVRSYRDGQPDTLYFLDGNGNGLGGGMLLARHSIGAASNFMRMMIASDLCAQGSCPGTDHHDDLLAQGNGAATQIYSLQGPMGQFTHVDPYVTEQSLADFDGNGDLEIGTTISIGALGHMHLEVREPDGQLRWTRRLTSTTEYNAETAVADVNGDGASDIIRAGGYGEIEVYSGIDGSMLSGFPLYLSHGTGTATVGNEPLPIAQVAAADIDGDGHMEALVAHDDGYLYAVNIATAEGPPAIAWTTYLGAPVSSLNVADLDNDGALEILASVQDGHLYIVDNDPAHVTIDQPAIGACITPSTIQVSGNAFGVEEIVVSVNGAPVATVSTNGAFHVPVVFPGEGQFVISIAGFSNGVQTTSTGINVTHWTDNDGDGFSECESDCNDESAASHPGAFEVCDGLDNDCDGEVPAAESQDVDGDGIFGCLDVCADTVPDTGVVLPNRLRWFGGANFTTNTNSANQPVYTQSSISVTDTHGCSCAQIASALGAGIGHTKHGCSTELMTQWLSQFASP
ncbi:MAG TPA: FG-GAP-like repeat-containing protein [Polyangium sp.]|nr:FG-GAP-like repeat-containing protein [Polyangium sp.]